jgi:hypothetical protein
VPRSIVLLSDGTGNSAAKLFRTNVWRFYQALDLSSAGQVARYDDGVGSSSIKPLAIIGGAVGWGLKRNLIDLYMFLCRNYQPGDQIYCVGFSRGAFTIRLLIQFVLSQGLVTNFNSSSDLRHKARTLYQRFRRTRKYTPPLTWLARFVRKVTFDWVMSTSYWWLFFVRRRSVKKLELKLEKNPGNSDLQRRIEELKFDARIINTTPVPQIRFVGLWDTVSAYGVPIYELKLGIDTYIWPMSLEDHDLDDRINKACHALAIDDKRSTFHPLLWDESDEQRFPLRDHTDHEKLTQVWFAGTHSNVGGGYPDDGMSYVSLRWMLNEARKQQLRLRPAALAEIEGAAAPYGRMYDSRAGFGSYYRYNPRRLDTPADGQKALIRHPKIHESVIWRMAAGTDAYAPLGLPNELRIVIDVPTDHGTENRSEGATFQSPPPNIYTFHSYHEAVRAEGNLFGDSPSSETHERREHASPKIAELRQAEGWVLDLIWDTVWWRRIAYFVSLIVTILLVSVPFLPFNLSDTAQQTGVAEVFESAGWIVKFIAGTATAILPVIFRPWIESFVRDPAGLGFLVAILVASLAWGRLLDRTIQDRALAAWNAPWRHRRYEWLRLSVGRRVFLPIVLAVYGTPAWLLAYSGRDTVENCNTGWCVEQIHSYNTNLAIAFMLLFATWAYAIYLIWLQKQGRIANSEVAGLALRIAHVLRTGWVRDSYRALTGKAVPLLLAFLVVVLAIAGVSRFAFALMSSTGWICGQGDGLPPRPDGIATADINKGCNRTGIYLEADASYRIEVVGTDSWGKDFGSIIGSVGRSAHGEVAIPLLKAPLVALLIPFRRNLTENWLTPLVRIGGIGADEYVVGPKGAVVTPRHGGELFFYVNDAVLGWPFSWDVFYGGNSGKATLKVTPTKP